MEVKKLYNILLNFLGKQNWWPVRYKNKISEGYDYRVEVIIGSILTQNSKWEKVEEIIKRSYDKVNYTLEFFLNEEEDKLYEIFKGISFLRRKIKTIKELFKFIKEKYNNLDSFGKLDVNTMRKELLKIYGIGKETADDIILYAFNKRTFPVDKYTKILFRNLNIVDDGSYEYIRKFVLEELNNVEDLKEFHALIDVFFKSFCKKNKCEDCILKKYCKIWMKK